jgi:hypothetical protein
MSLVQATDWRSMCATVGGPDRAAAAILQRRMANGLYGDGLAPSPARRPGGA